MDKKRKMMKIFCLLLAAFSSPVFAGEWKAKIAKELNALVTSCVVVPCSFTHPHGNLPTSRLRGTWHLSKNSTERIYDEDNSNVMDSYKERTQLLGLLGQNNCTLEIVDVKDYDNGPFCFQIEIVQTQTDTSSEKHSFDNNCVRLKMLPDPPKPTMTSQKVAIQDHPYTVTCSVTHTCPSHRPKLTWSRGTANEVTHMFRELQFGYWEELSILTFIPKEDDDHSELTCTAKFHGERVSSTTRTVFIKRAENYKYVIVPTMVGIVTAVIFGALCSFVIKKYKTSTVNSKCGTSNKFSKARFPSPKRYDLDDGDDYINTADLNIYGNL
uniref:Ig-like domain-containing protein n=1 Tax=Mola mola TaxID=94237 RepID=A0A3Q3XE86_MOLML